MKDPIGFVGLGNMGSGMARNILKSGFPLIGYDVREEPLRAIEGMGGRERKALGRSPEGLGSPS